MPPAQPDPPPLLGTYTAPAVRVGAVVRCRYRRADCRVTAWSAAPIPWPRCNQVGIQGGSGLLVNEELVRAIRTESAEAIKHWFGVGTKAVWNWRRRFVPGDGKYRTEGSKAAHQLASDAGGAKTRGRPLPDEVRAARSAAAKSAGRKYPARWVYGDWTAEELALLGTAPDEKVAGLIGRTVGAVTKKRRERRIPRFR